MPIADKEYRLRTPILLLAVCLAVVLPAKAKLSWDMTSHTFESHPLQVSQTLHFPFVNSGEESVTIKAVKSNCGCVSGKAEPLITAPGETGTVVVTFDLSRRLGFQRKGVNVISDDGREQMLYVGTTIPEAYTLPVRRLVWREGEDRTPKSCRLVSRFSRPLPLERVSGARAGVDAELRPIRPGFEYEMLITPGPGFDGGLVAFTVYPEIPAGLDAVRTYTVYALVR